LSRSAHNQFNIPRAVHARKILSLLSASSVSGIRHPPGGPVEPDPTGYRVE
jgi:hypothetical protein